MLYWVIKQTVISLVLIILLHYLYFFFKTNLTEPKIKDLVNKPLKQYIEIYNTIDGKNEKNSKPINTGKMKEELKQYLKTLSSKNEIVAADSFNVNYQML